MPGIIISDERSYICRKIREVSRMTLNYLCENDISDEDCYKCSRHGIVFRCTAGCPDFKDVRKKMSAEQLRERNELMEKMGIKDDPKWE